MGSVTHEIWFKEENERFGCAMGASTRNQKERMKRYVSRGNDTWILFGNIKGRKARVYPGQPSTTVSKRNIHVPESIRVSLEELERSNLPPVSGSWSDCYS
ncbi:hypothetical protein TNCT_588101 [Trichonephila clavata]|uniref:Uncharacterized protein n=1 Tax=Trichonephila clavata TaxID=2740835 RepID=A0A8X6LCH6_TRICU|nr:hypothetical protein TNCT_588101 [Trichonephila clavata]